MLSFLTRLWVKWFGKTRSNEVIKGGEIRGQKLKFCTLVDAELFDCIVVSSIMVRCGIYDTSFSASSIEQCVVGTAGHPLARLIYPLRRV